MQKNLNKIFTPYSGVDKECGEPYQIIDQLKTLDEYYTNREPVESYVFNSTVPYGVDVDSKASLDKAFVEMVQTGSLENVSVPDVKFVTSTRLSRSAHYGTT